MGQRPKWINDILKQLKSKNVVYANTIYSIGTLTLTLVKAWFTF